MSSSAAPGSDFVDAYSQYVASVLKPAEAQVRDAFYKWRRENYWAHFKLRGSETIPNPVQRVRVRVKRPESVIDKINRLPSKFPKGLSDDNLPKVVLHFGYALPQREIGGLYDILALSQISTVGQLWDRGTQAVVRTMSDTNVTLAGQGYVHRGQVSSARRLP